MHAGPNHLVESLSQETVEAMLRLGTLQSTWPACARSEQRITAAAEAPAASGHEA